MKVNITKEESRIMLELLTGSIHKHKTFIDVCGNDLELTYAKQQAERQLLVEKKLYSMFFDVANWVIED